MKTCTRCGEEKPLELFYKNKTMADGHLNQCKACKKADHKAYQLDNLDKFREYNKRFFANNKEWHCKRVSEWNKNNRDYCNTVQAERRAKIVLGEQEWTSEEREQIRYLYWLAKDLTAVSGEQYHVDHIHPLSKGGEHRLDNLQILHAEDNLRKGAKHG